MDTQKYLENPFHCPLCESFRVIATDRDYLDTYHFVYMKCLDCDSAWTDHYKISSVHVDFDMRQEVG